MKQIKWIYIVYLLLLGLAAWVIVWVTRINKTDRISYRENLYVRNCANCHGLEGEGLRNLYPSLTDTFWLQPEIFACVVKTGLSDTIFVSGKKFYGRMPANPHLRADQAAEILRYIQETFHKQPSSPTLKADVEKAWANCGENE